MSMNDNHECEPNSICCHFDPVVPREQNLSTWSEYLDKPVVWLTEYRTFGWLIQEGAHFATVVYTVDGNDYEEQIENDEYIIWGDYAIDYETDE